MQACHRRLVGGRVVRVGRLGREAEAGRGGLQEDPRAAEAHRAEREHAAVRRGRGDELGDAADVVLAAAAKLVARAAGGEVHVAVLAEPAVDGAARLEVDEHHPVGGAAAADDRVPARQDDDLLRLRLVPSQVGSAIPFVPKVVSRRPAVV